LAANEKRKGVDTAIKKGSEDLECGGRRGNERKPPEACRRARGVNTVTASVGMAYR